MSAAYFFQSEYRARHYDGSYQPFYYSDGGFDFDPCFSVPAAWNSKTVDNSLPQAVLGGCTVMMFGSIMYEGIKMLKVCVFDDRTMIIVSLAFCIGVGLTQTSGNFFSAFPKEVGDIFNGNAVAGVFVVSLILSICLPKKKTTDL